MAKSRVPTTVKRYVPPVAQLTGGDGSPAPEIDAKDLTRIETLLREMQCTLDVQFVRMSEMQVLIDRLIDEPD